jgi:arylsulfatase A-like enzyme
MKSLIRECTVLKTTGFQLDRGWERPPMRRGKKRFDFTGALGRGIPGAAAVLVAAAQLSAFAGAGDARERPNFVVLVSEDNSVHYIDHFIPGGAVLPKIEALAENGITFDRAFSNASVCSVARTSVITGVYAPRNATHHHRRLARTSHTPSREMFPYYLRGAEYYTIKNGKKDFNATEGEIWDQDGGQAHWRNRPDDDTPFFYMEQTGTDTHEGRLHFDRENFRNEPTEHHPDQVEVFPYLPDTDLIRYTHAFYLDRHLELDRKVGEVFAELEGDGLRENSIIIYYGDRDGSLPRSKGYIYESGLHVPMVIQIPEKFRHLSPFEEGGRVDGFVEFVDIGPTILNLAGAGLPSHMDGRPFLGPDITAEQVAERDETFSYADSNKSNYE